MAVLIPIRTTSTGNGDPRRRGADPSKDQRDMHHHHAGIGLEHNHIGFYPGIFAFDQEVDDKRNPVTAEQTDERHQHSRGHDRPHLADDLKENLNERQKTRPVRACHIRFVMKQLQDNEPVDPDECSVMHDKEGDGKQFAKMPGGTGRLDANHLQDRKKTDGEVFRPIQQDYRKRVPASKQDAPQGNQVGDNQGYQGQV